VSTFTRSFVALAALTLAAGAAQAHISVYTTSLSGPAESPPNPSPGIGFSEVVIDEDNFRMTIYAEFSGLTAGTTASHIHGPTPTPFSGVAGVMTPTPSFPGFPLGVTSGIYEREFDMTLPSSYGNAFLSSQGGNTLTAFSTFLTAMNEGRAYLNIHSTAFPGGEIRGFYTVPAPGAGAMVLLGGLVAARRRR
jgi:hypothetical protein